MKMMSMKMMAIMAGIGYMGYMYFSKHPDKLKKIREIGMNSTKDMTDVMMEK